MQADIDAMGDPSANVATGAGVFLPLPGMQAQQPGQPLQDPAVMMQNMMQIMMEAMRASFQQPVPGAAGARAPPQRHSTRHGAATGGKTRTWQMCVSTSVRFVVSISSRTGMTKIESGVFSVLYGDS